MAHRPERPPRPVVTTKWLAGELFRDQTPLNAVRWGHVLASLAAPLVGLGRPYFGYYLVSARRGGAAPG